MKYIKSIFSTLLFLALFFVPILSNAQSVAVCSPACGYNETCISSADQGSTQKNYCQVNYGSGNRYLDNTGGSGEGGVITPVCDATNSCNTVTDTRILNVSNNNGNPDSTACQSLASNPSTYFQTGSITGTGPVNNGLILLSGYGNTNYATPEAAALLASCLGGTVVVTPSPPGPFYIPPSLDVIQPDGTRSNAGVLLQMLQNCNGDSSCWQYKLSQADKPVVGGGTSTTGTGTVAGGTSTAGITNASCLSDGTCTAAQATVLQQAVTNSTNSAKQQISSSVQTTLNNIKASVNSFTQQFNGYAKSLGYDFSTATSKPVTPTPACSVGLSTDLRLGSTGSDITTLTTKLVSEGLLTTPTSTFDNTVFNAVVSYQEKYATQILTPLGLTQGTGFVGPATRTQINSSLCAGNTTGNTTTTTTGGTTSQTNPITAGTKTSNFNYTFTKVGTMWKVTMDNAPLGTIANMYYIPANYSITSFSAADMNAQNQYRFNNTANYPGYAAGDTFYTEMFKAYNRAFYDWNNQTNTAVSPGSSTLTNSLTVNGYQSITANVGDQLNYIWTSTSGQSFESYYTANKADTCPSGISVAGATKPWSANSANGSTSQVVQACQAGVTYTVTFVIHNSPGVPDVLKTIVVNVTNLGTVSATLPNLSSTQPVTPYAQTSLVIPATASTPVTPVVLASDSTLASTETLASNYTSNIGVYHWGVFSDPSGPILGGVNFAASKGFKIMRLALSPRSSIDYGASSTCDSGLSLTQLVQKNGFSQALANSSINTFILTTYDGTSFSDCQTKKYMNPTFYTTANTNAVVQEYYDFAMYLYQTYKNTGKLFIIDNWEGDNNLYCGQAYNYATSASFKSYCDSNYSSLYNGNTSVNDSISGMKLWLAARTAGIDKARVAAGVQGITGVVVDSAGELSIVTALHSNGYKSMLYDVLPSLSLDYISYSSYESINNSTPATTLNSDIQTIKNVTGVNNIIVGEFGYSPDQVGATNAPAYLQQVAQDISSSGATYGIIWDLFDQPSSNFGLFTQQKTATSMFSVLKK